MSGRAAAVGAQAKVNLFLHVLSREDSGYHQIETLFCRLELADEVVVRLPGTGAGTARSIDCAGDDTGPPEENLAYRAAALYAECRGWPSGFAIEVTKHIPVGGGRGGGSADAGAVLRALRALDPDPPDAATLQRWAARLGADVPVMTLDSPLALGWGRGEQLLPLPALPSRAVMLYVPEFRVATREAYQWWDEPRRSTATATRRLSGRAQAPRSRSGDARRLGPRGATHDQRFRGRGRCAAPGNPDHDDAATRTAGRRCRAVKWFRIDGVLRDVRIAPASRPDRAAGRRHRRADHHGGPRCRSAPDRLA